jgi:hypothetical protein
VSLKTSADFNQPIPNTIVQALFMNPVNLSNLHQPWLIDRAVSLPTAAVATEIVFVSLQQNFSYVNTVDLSSLTMLEYFYA